MRLTARTPEIPPEGGFTETNDIFGYRPFGENLANLFENIDEPLVVLLDGPWGSGKSTFIQQWRGLLTKRGIPSIYFDAFANDYQDDAFTALVSEVFSFSESERSGKANLQSAFLDSAKKVGGLLLPIGVKAAIRAGSMGLLSADDFQINENIREALSDGASDLTSAAELAVKERIKKSSENKGTIEHFRHTLSQISHDLTVGGHKRSGPLIFVIDELDRCRPPFALNVLERVKHLFAVEGVCFLLVTHRPQLARVIKGSYGSEFDADTYLRKFFQLTVNLPHYRESEKGYAKIRKYIEHIWTDIELKGTAQFTKESIHETANLAVGLGLELRDIEHVMASLAVFIAGVEENNYYSEPVLVVLSLMRIKAPDLFERCTLGTVTWEEVKDFLGIENWSDPNEHRKPYQQHWRALLDDNWSGLRADNTKLSVRLETEDSGFSSPRDAVVYVSRIMSNIRISNF